MDKQKLDEDMNDLSEPAEPAKFFQNKVLLEDGIVKFDLMISLQNIAMVKVITHLWMNKNVQQQLWYLFHKDPKFSVPYSKIIDVYILNRVAGQVSELPLPDCIAKNLRPLVPKMGNCIFHWIWYHDQSVFFTSKNSKYFAVDFISNITWTITGKIDYLQTAKNILANKNNGLSEDDKYKLACSYCLEKEIAALAETVVHKDYLNERYYIDLNPMIYFWTSSITGDSYLDNSSYFSRYHNSTTDNIISFNERIVKLLIFNNNETISSFAPVSYMWNKLNKEEKDRNINGLIANLNNQHQDFWYILLSNLDFDQQQKVFTKFSASILIGILNDWLFREYFLAVALYVLDVMSPFDYAHILQRVSSEIKMNSKEEKNQHLYKECKSVFKTLWQKGTKHNKDFLPNCSSGCMLRNLVAYALSWEQDLDIIDLIFNDLNAGVKKKLIFDSVERCLSFIKDDRWDLLELFINYTLSSEEDVKKLKERLVTEKYHVILHFFTIGALDKADDFMNWASLSEDDRRQLKGELIRKNHFVILHCVKEEAFNTIESYMHWAFESKEEIRQFKESLVMLDGREILLDFLEQEAFDKLENCMRWALESEKEIDCLRLSFASANIKETTLESLITFFKDTGFTKLENRLQWCAKGDVKLISHLKTEVFMSFCKTLSSENTVRKFINEDHFELLEEILNWCFLDNQNNIVRFKSMHKYTNLVFYIRLLIFHLIKFGNSFEKLEKFLSCYFTSEQETQEFKTWMLYPLESSGNVCVALLCANEFKLAQKFTYWCCISYEAERKFKNALILSNCYMETILNSTNEYAKDNFQLLIKWLNPSKETLDLFFTLLSENSCPNYFKFHEAVKEFVVRQSHLKLGVDESIFQEWKSSLGF